MQPRESTPGRLPAQPADALAECVKACFAASRACTACADACLAEDDASHLTQCIRLCLDCAEVSASAGDVANRRIGHNEAVLRDALHACVTACLACAEECDHHIGRRGYSHCAACAEACRRCAEACRKVVDGLPA
jgi:hypothetical protein